MKTILQVLQIASEPLLLTIFICLRKSSFVSAIVQKLKKTA